MSQLDFKLKESDSGKASLTAGRSSWAAPFIIGVAGGTASGKTTVCDLIMQRLHDQCVVIVSQDSFYRSLGEKELENVKHYNFDVPEAFDKAEVVNCLETLGRGEAYDVPIYDFASHSRSKATRRVEPADVIIMEGILVLHMPEVRNLCHMKVFVDTDDDVRLARRIQRDVAVRGRDVAGVIEQYTKFVKPAFDTYVAPSRRHADLIIPWQRGDNVVAIDLITQHIRHKLRQPDMARIYNNFIIIPSNFQIRGMHTIIRNKETSKNDFVFYADRLCRIMVEAGLGYLPFEEYTVTTPTDTEYTGVKFAPKLCGVSIIRSGEAMESSLRACCQGIKIGKILVMRHKPLDVEERKKSLELADVDVPPLFVDGCDHAGGLSKESLVDKQEIIYERLPEDIADRHVLLMDPVLGTGNTACRAIEVLLSKGVPQNHIIMLTIIAAPPGIHKVCSTYKDVKLLTSAVDKDVNKFYQVVPGLGEFGDRYFSD